MEISFRSPFSAGFAETYSLHRLSSLSVELEQMIKCIKHKLRVLFYLFSPLFPFDVRRKQFLILGILCIGKALAISSDF